MVDTLTELDGRAEFEIPIFLATGMSLLTLFPGMVALVLTNESIMTL